MDKIPSEESGENPLSTADMWSFFVNELSDKELGILGSSIHTEQRRRAMNSGDQEEIIAHAFDVGFERSGLGVLPWIEGPFLVCPGALISKSQASHRCRFISVNDEWVWQSKMLIEETKRPSPGSDTGFRAIALIPIIEGTAVDIVSGRLQSGQHRAQKVVSLEVRDGKLSEVSQRVVPLDGMHS
tara:strand:+ start:169 stop:723 length:555 start_codon:yes stop_codon:yes gene_type:complete